jgi:ATP-dependent Lhr-like helicase
MEGLLYAAACAASGDPKIRGASQKVLDLLESSGALFFSEIRAGTGLLAVQVEEALRELVAVGTVTADGFGSLRRLLDTGPKRRRARQRKRRIGLQAGADLEGRWGLLRARGPAPDAEVLYEEAAWRLLRRYGVVFRDLLAREWFPGAWRTIHRALRRLEARGQVRGGRFVAGWIGEQFALPQAVTMLRQARDGASRSVEIQISACDPLNLAGVLTPGRRVAAGPDRRLLLRDGLPVAVLERGETTELGVSIE